MHGPPLVGWLLVALSAATGLSCLRRHSARDEALMGCGMALTAVPMSVLDPRPWGTALLVVVFAAATVRALVQGVTRRSGRHLHHAVGAAAMVYMAVAMAGEATAGDRAGHAGHGPSGSAPLTGALSLYFAAYALAAGLRLFAATAVAVPASAGGGLAPPAADPHGSEMAAACRVSMALGMLAMLLSM